MEIHGLRFQVIPRIGIPVHDTCTDKMAKGILAELRKALLREEISEKIVTNMVNTKGGKIYFGLDAIEGLLTKVAGKTKNLLNEGEPGNYETLVKAIRFFSDAYAKPARVKRLKTFTPAKGKKEKVVEGLWLPLATQVIHDKQGRPQTFMIFKKDEENDNTVSDAQGLRLLAEIAGKASRMGEPNLVKENPVLAKILETPPLCSKQGKKDHNFQ